MLEYSSGKFLNLKINTNASLLNEKKIRNFKKRCKNPCFSADAADEDLYSNLELEEIIKSSKKY